MNLNGLDKYEIIKLIGSGGYGEVFLAEDRTNKQQ